MVGAERWRLDKMLPTTKSSGNGRVEAGDEPV